MSTLKNRTRVAVALAIGGGTLAAVAVGATAATAPAAPAAALPGCGYGEVGYNTPVCNILPTGSIPTATATASTAPSATATATATATPTGPFTFTLGTNVIAAGQRTKVIVKGTAGDQVQILVKGAASRSYTVLATQRINSAGQTSLSISPSTNSSYEVRDAKTTAAAKSLKVKAVQSLEITRKGHTVTFRGHIAPSLVGRRVTIYDYKSGQHVAVACTTKTTSGGQYACSHTFPAGTYSSFAETESDAYNAAGRSPLHKNTF